MLGMRKFSRDYIDACRDRVGAGLRVYRKHAKRTASVELAQRFFNDQVLLLDYMFVHRLAGVEGKDGNPLNEVRVLCNSLLYNGGRLQVDKLPGWPKSAGSGIDLAPEKSLLELKPGETVGLTEADFVRLAKAFFAEIEKRYA